MGDYISGPIGRNELNAATVLEAYRQGFFPMGCGEGELRWFSPDPRGIIRLEKFRLPHGFRRAIKKLPYRVTGNKAFREVLEGCAGRKETWITPEIMEVYMELHGGGYAHSVEVWHDEKLVGGLYGVQIRAAFFGESMFSRENDASKLALLVLVNLLREKEIKLLDIQWVTNHLEGFGAEEVSRAEYLRLLRRAMAQDAK